MTGLPSNIKRLLQERHLKQVDLADALGISNGTLSDWLKGRYYPRHKYIVAMSEFFGVPVDEITKEKDTNLDDRLMSLFNSLPASKQEQTIEYMKFLLQSGQE